MAYFCVSIILSLHFFYCLTPLTLRGLLWKVKVNYTKIQCDNMICIYQKFKINKWERELKRAFLLFTGKLSMEKRMALTLHGGQFRYTDHPWATWFGDTALDDILQQATHVPASKFWAGKQRTLMGTIPFVKQRVCCLKFLFLVSLLAFGFRHIASC